MFLLYLYNDDMNFDTKLDIGCTLEVRKYTSRISMSSYSMQISVTNKQLFVLELIIVIDVQTFNASLRFRIIRSNYSVCKYSNKICFYWH